MPRKTVTSLSTKQTPEQPAEPMLSPEDAHFHSHAEAVYRIHGPFYPNKRIRVVLRAMEQPWGDPEGVTVLEGGTGMNVIDDAYMGYRDFGETPENAHEDIAYTIIARVPRSLRPGETVHEKTSPDFSHKPALNRLLWQAPVLFEQLKYQYETREQKLCTQRHSHVPIPRASRKPVGKLAAPRDTAKRPSILIGFHWLETGGAEKLAFDCVQWALDAGFRVLVVAERADVHRHAHKLPDHPDVEFIRADAYLKPDQWFGFLEALIRAENIRAIHIHHNVRLYDNLMLLKAAFPDLVIIDSTHIIEYSNGGFPRTSGVWTNYIDYHHAISRELVSFYLDHFSVSERVLLGRMLPPVDTTQEQPEPELRLKAGQKTLRLAFVGRMVHQKRAPLVVEITRKLQKWARTQGVKIAVDMVGTGPYLDVVRHMITKANLGSVITLHPPTSDVPALLGKADILILPSSNEGLALVCYEAVQNGALPISTDVGGQDELVPESLLVPASPRACIRDTVALVEKLVTDAAFLESCKTDTLASYRGLRADPTAQDVLTALYKDIVKGCPSK